MKKLALLLLMVGCGLDKEPLPNLLPSLNPDPAPRGGFQIVTPVVDNLGPGSDTEVCTWTDKITTEQTDVRWTQGYQSEPGGHHIVLYYTMIHQPPGTQRTCTDADMATFRLVSGNGEAGTRNMAPGNLVYRIPKGAQLVVNHHWLNTTDQTVSGQAVLNVSPAEPGSSYVPSGNTAILDTSIDIPPGHYEKDIHCTFDRQMKLWYLIPHEHQYGSHMSISLTRSGAVETPFDIDWSPSFTFHPPEDRKDPSAPLIVQPGDTVDVKCQWENTTDHDLLFGPEMCVAFGQFVDDQNKGNWACDGGSWSDF